MMHRRQRPAKRVKHTPQPPAEPSRRSSRLQQQEAEQPEPGSELAVFIINGECPRCGPAQALCHYAPHAAGLADACMQHLHVPHSTALLPHRCYAPLSLAGHFTHCIITSQLRLYEKTQRTYFH